MSDTRTTEDLLARRALAEKATPGPWETDKSGNVSAGGAKEPIIYMNDDINADEDIILPSVEDAAHIAVNDPTTVMADIDEILRLRAEVERLEKEMQWIAERASIKDCIMDDTVENCIKKGFPCVACFREAARKAIGESNANS